MQAASSRSNRILLLAALLLASPATAGKVDWLTFAHDVQRTGENPGETQLSPGNASGLQLLWSFDLKAVTISSPALATDVAVGGATRDLLYMGSEHGELFAIDAATGALVWQQALGRAIPRCNQIIMPDGIWGVSGTPVIDRPSNRLYAVGGRGRLSALDLATGKRLRNWSVSLTRQPLLEHVYGGLTLANGVVYATLASYCESPRYHGAVIGVDVARARITSSWYPTGAKGPGGGGIWGPGGVSVDSTDGNVYAATGNALTSPENFGYSEHVVRLTPELGVVAANYPGLQGQDVDFGATPILYQPPGCPLQVAAKNKSGILVVYGHDSIASGPTQRLQIASVNDWQFNGVPAYSAATNMLYVSNSSDSNDGTYQHGMVALQVQPDCSLALAWQRALGPNDTSVSPPTVANGVVYYGDGAGRRLHALDAASGVELWDSGATIGGPVYAAPVPINGRLYAGAWDGKLYAFTAP